MYPESRFRTCLDFLSFGVFPIQFLEHTVHLQNSWESLATAARNKIMKPQNHLPIKSYKYGFIISYSLLHYVECRSLHLTSPFSVARPVQPRRQSQHVPASPLQPTRSSRIRGNSVENFWPPSTSWIFTSGCPRLRPGIQWGFQLVMGVAPE